MGEHRAGRGLPWSDKAPARAELFGIERLDANAAVLLAAYRASAREGEGGASRPSLFSAQ